MSFQESPKTSRLALKTNVPRTVFISWSVNSVENKDLSIGGEEVTFHIFEVSDCTAICAEEADRSVDNTAFCFC